MLRKIILLMAVTLMFSSTCFAADRTFAWDPSTTANVTHYTLYYTGAVDGQTGAIPAEVDTAGNMNYILDTTSMNGDYSFYVTASNQDGESLPSNVVLSFLGVPEPVLNFRLQ